MSKKITVQVPATSANLGPGFDVLGVALKLYNDVVLETDSQSWKSVKSSLSLQVHIEGDGAHTLPRDGSDLVMRAAFRVFAKARRWPTTLRAHLVNRIPLSRGLGSSSAAIVSGVCAANALVGRPLSQEQLLDLATEMEGHPDNVVPAMLGGFCLSAIVNRQVRFLKFSAPAGLKAVICSPEKPLSTRAARGVVPQRFTRADTVFTSSHVAFLVGALAQKRYDLLGFAMDDVLHQPARARLIPGLMKAIAAARKAGAYGAALSGAGTTAIALTPGGAVARRVGIAMRNAFRSAGMPSRAQALEFDNKGVRYS